MTLAVGAGYAVIGTMFALGDPMLRTFWVIVSLFSRIFCHQHHCGLRSSGWLRDCDRTVHSDFGSAHFDGTEGDGNALGGRPDDAGSHHRRAGRSIICWSETEGLSCPVHRRASGQRRRFAGLLHHRSAPWRKKTAKKITRMAMLGTSAMRRNIQRSDYSPHLCGANGRCRRARRKTGGYRRQLGAP